MNALFVHIPKTGGASIKQAMGHGLSVIKEGSGSRLTNSTLDKGGLITVGHNTWIDLANSGADIGHSFLSDCYKFAAVRNPWARLVSLYRYIRFVSSRSGPESFDWRWVGAGSFDDFCKLLLERTREWDNTESEGYDLPSARERLAPQTEWTNTFGIPRDQILRFESLSIDWVPVASKLGVRVELPHKNRLTDLAAVEATGDYRRFYGDDTVEIVADLYGSDIAAFNYTFED